MDTVKDVNSRLTESNLGPRLKVYTKTSYEECYCTNVMTTIMVKVVVIKEIEIII